MPGLYRTLWRNIEKIKKVVDIWGAMAYNVFCCEQHNRETDHKRP